MRKSIAVGFICAVTLLPRWAFAWGSAGHELIAAEAYRELSPELKAEVAAVLQAHPAYAQWKAAYHSNAVLDVYAYVFIRSSTWPDEIRRSGSPYDHPEWHFIDYPLHPPDFPMLPGPTPDNDVLFGIGQCEKVLADTNAAPELRAVMLSSMVHLIGDLHQPLHCAPSSPPPIRLATAGPMNFTSHRAIREYPCTVCGTACWVRPPIREPNGIMASPWMPNIPEAPCPS
jgi:hypothetical protein